MTNTFLPFIGGVERSIENFTKEYRKYKHNVLIVAPIYKGIQKHEDCVLRVPAIKNIKGTDFSFQIPIPGYLNKSIKQFMPDIVHSHHPFLLGDSALRIASLYNIPIIFTFHTFYDAYTHYVSEHSEALKKFINKLTIEYANLCDHVFAPTHYVKDELLRRGVRVGIDIVPTGIYTEEYLNTNRYKARNRYNIPLKKFVIGFVSRIAREKNIMFLLEVIKLCMHKNDNVCFLLIGKGPILGDVITFFDHSDLGNRFYYAGVLLGRELIDAYKAMDLFLFASKTETQGLVLIEAMASGVPVVALSNPVVNELVVDQYNGYIVKEENAFDFAESVNSYIESNEFSRNRIKENAITTAKKYGQNDIANNALQIYIQTKNEKEMKNRVMSKNSLSKLVRTIKTEYDLLKSKSMAAAAAFVDNK
jgi:glycosyltransferase involved in cell wall biosynthesis